MGLIAQRLAVTLGGAQVLGDVSVSLGSGQVTAICGPNGAGKSTLLNVLAGLIDPGKGSVNINDQPLTAMPLEERARALGYLPQQGEVAWDLSVENLVALGRLPHRDRDDGAIRRALEKVEMTAFAQRPVSTLSGGEKARVLLARVLATEPQWLLVDEPLAALDLGHRLATLRQLRREAEEGTGVVIVLHDLAQAMNHADQVAVLDQGRLVAMGPPQEALAPAMIAQVWGVAAHWLGEPGTQALVVESQALLA